MKHIYRSGVLTALFTLCSFAHADAIPSCPSGTMADYLAFGATGCQFDGAIFSNFSYVDTLVTGLSAPPGEVSVEPSSIFGDVGLVFSPRGAWSLVNIDFEVQGPGIVRDDLSGRLGNFGGGPPFAWDAGVTESAAPGESRSLSILNTPTCRFVEPPCRDFDSISFTSTSPQNIHILGGGSDGGGAGSIAVGFAVTPEPSVVLMLGASLAVLTARAWRRHRR